MATVERSHRRRAAPSDPEVLDRQSEPCQTSAASKSHQVRINDVSSRWPSDLRPRDFIEYPSGARVRDVGEPRKLSGDRTVRSDWSEADTAERKGPEDRPKGGGGADAKLNSVLSFGSQLGCDEDDKDTMPETGSESTWDTWAVFDGIDR